MAEAADKESKTEQATEKKIRDSLDKGQIPFAKEVPIFASFVAALLFTFFFARDTAVRLSDFLSVFLEKPDEWVLGTNADAVGLYQLVFMEMARALVIMLAMIVVFGLGASLLQNPPQFVGDRIMPKLERISLAKGWSRIFGAKGFAEFVKSVAKMVFVSGFLVLVLRDAPARLLSGMSTNPAAFGIVVLELAVEMLVTITLVMALISVADLIWSR
ncbi:MAG: EscU/YscU/HrcU family type III secretion system export apparatus switch protein, partial [Mesorhizobium sp.]|nr:EscU/YscU/HrcU family type III secretion system export apparatus switch protein [Mesorhizobium sp.]